MLTDPSKQLWFYLTGCLMFALGAVATLIEARYEAVQRPTSFGAQHSSRRSHLSLGWDVDRIMNAGEVHAIRSWPASVMVRKPAPMMDRQGSWSDWSRTSRPCHDDPRFAASLWECPYGWPMRSMVGEVLESTVRQSSVFTPVAGTLMYEQYAHGFWNARWFATPWWTSGFMQDSRSITEWEDDVSLTHFEDQIPRIFPTRIVPLGFFVNSACYGALAWLGTIAARAAYRIERDAIVARRNRWRARAVRV